MLLLFSMSLYPKLRLWCQLSAFSVLHIPFKLSKLFQVQWHQHGAEGTLTVLILWQCSWQSLAALIHSLAVCWQRAETTVCAGSCLFNWCSLVVWLGSWDVCCSSAVGAWGAPGHTASQFLCAPMGCDCLALQDCLKSFTLPFLAK